MKKHPQGAGRSQQLELHWLCLPAAQIGPREFLAASLSFFRVIKWRFGVSEAPKNKTNKTTNFCALGEAFCGCATFWGFLWAELSWQLNSLQNGILMWRKWVLTHKN